MTLTKEEQQTVGKAVQDTLDYVKQHSPKDFQKLEDNPVYMKNVMKAAEIAAAEQVHLSKYFKEESSNIEETLKGKITDKRMNLLKNGLSIPTFRLDISKRLDDGKYVAAFTCKNEKLLEPRILNSLISIESTASKQYGSIVTEAVMLVMSVVGISVTPGEHAVEQAVDEAAFVIQASSKFKGAIETFIKDWSSAGSSADQKGIAMYQLLKETYATGILWKVIKAICSNMKWYEWMETSAKVTAMLVASFATEGGALIAKISMVALSAVDFTKKIGNIIHLNNIKEEMF